MPDELEPEKFWRERLPSAISEVLFSENTSLQIAGICAGNGVAGEKDIEKVASKIGLVLLGKLPPEELVSVLRKDLQMEADLAEKIYSETDRLIFVQIKDDLAGLYGKEAPPDKTESLPEKPKTPPRKDVYRERID